MITVLKIKTIILFLTSFSLYAQESLSPDLFWAEVKISIQKNNYQKSYDLLKAVDLKNAVINHQILYDISAFRLKKDEKLLCLKSLNKYPQSTTQVYTMALCNLLNIKRMGKKIEADKRENFKKLLKEYPKENYLLKVVEGI